jgi:hypothetical protein
MADTADNQNEVLTPDEVQDADVDSEEIEQKESVSQPAKVMRVGSMIRQLLDEAHNTSLDEASRSRLSDIYEVSVKELGDALSPDLQDELDRLVLPFLQDGDAVPSESEVKIAQAQLIGWLEGLFHGIQATLFAQQAAARQQLEQMRGQIPANTGEGGPEGRPGTYL